MTKDKTNIEEIKEIHKEVIEFMDSIGFGLLTDGETFYKKGYELEPREHTTFTMQQAYEIRNRTKDQVQAECGYIQWLKDEHENGRLKIAHMNYAIFLFQTYLQTLKEQRKHE